MRNNSLKSLLAVLALAMLVTPAFAKPETRIITIDGTEKIAGKELKNDVFAFKVDDTKLVVELREAKSSRKLPDVGNRAIRNTTPTP